MGWGSSNPVDTAIEFNSESIRKSATILETGGIRGTRSHPKERTRSGTYTVGGSMSCNPGPTELAFLLPYILGANASGTTFALAETLPSAYITVDRVAKVFTYAGMKVNRGTFRCSQGQLLQLDLDLMGKTETVANAGTFPSLTLGTEAPYVFHDAVITIASTAYPVSDLDITIDNRLEGNRFQNSQTRTELPTMDRTVTVTVNTEFTSSTTALYDAANNYTGLSCTVVFTNGNYSITFTLPALQVPAQSPVVGGRNEIMMPLQFTARKSGSTAELTVTNDSTP
jgi:hypothetical protein